MTLILDRIVIEDAGCNPEKLAAAVLKQIPLQQLPVCVEDIAFALGIEEIREEPLDSVEACLLTDAGKASGSIIVNARSSKERRRYSVGHELGHFLNVSHFVNTTTAQCSTSDMRASGDTSDARREAEANRFAAALLLPRALLRPFLGGKPDLTQALSLATAGSVSKEAAIRRYVELHDFPMAALFVKDSVVRYVCKSKEFPRLKLWSGYRLPRAHGSLRFNGSAVSEITEADPDDWVSWARGELTLQALTQERGFQIVLLATDQ